MLVHKGAHGGRVKDALSLEAVRAEQVFHEGTHAPAQPLRHGNLKAPLVAVQDFPGQQPRKGPFEQPFALESVQLAIHGQTRGEFGHVLVQKGGAHFKAVQHGAAIHLDQDVVQHELVRVDIERARQRRGRIVGLPVFKLLASGRKKALRRKKARRLRLEGSGQNFGLHIGSKSGEHGLHPLPGRSLGRPQKSGHSKTRIDIPGGGRQAAGKGFHHLVTHQGGQGIVPFRHLEADVVLVPGPQFIRAVAAKSHGDLFPRDARKQPGGGHRGVGHGHVHPADDAGQVVGALFGGKHALMVVGAKGLGHYAGIARLAITGFAEADGKGLYGRGGLPRHKPGHNGRVNAARKKNAQGHVTDHAPTHGACHQKLQFFAKLIRAAPVALVGHGHVPVAARAHDAALDYQPVRGGQAFHLAIDGLRRGHILIGQVTHDGFGLHGQAQAGNFFQCRQFGGKMQFALLHGVEKGLFAKRVARAEKALLVGIPQGKGEHAVKAGQTVHAPLPVAFQYDLGVGAGAKTRSFGGKFLLKLREIIDLAVEYDGITPVNAVHGLAARAQVNDGKTPVPQADWAVQPLPFAVRPPVGDAIGHGLDPILGLGIKRRSVQLANTGYSTHVSFQHL